MDIPRSYTHDDMCSPDHDAHLCLTYRVDAACADLRCILVAFALFGGAR